MYTIDRRRVFGVDYFWERSWFLHPNKYETVHSATICERQRASVVPRRSIPWGRPCPPRDCEALRKLLEQEMPFNEDVLTPVLSWHKYARSGCDVSCVAMVGVWGRAEHPAGFGAEPHVEW